MVSQPQNEYVELRDGGYYVAGTGIGLDVLVHSFRLEVSGSDPSGLPFHWVSGESLRSDRLYLGEPRSGRDLPWRARRTLG